MTIIPNVRSLSSFWMDSDFSGFLIKERKENSEGKQTKQEEYETFWLRLEAEVVSE